tara:strand:+ start:309 stop:512 length:204 start_codon:yes stop_codon:yes gene_type:complete
MSVILRHKKLPFIMVYNDPKKSWNKVSKTMLLKEMEKDGFDNFVEESSIPLLFRNIFNFIVEKEKGS